MLLVGHSSPIKHFEGESPDVQVHLHTDEEMEGRATLEFRSGLNSPQCGQTTQVLPSHVTLRKVASVQPASRVQVDEKLRPCSITIWVFCSEPPTNEHLETSQDGRIRTSNLGQKTGFFEEERPLRSEVWSKETHIGMAAYRIYLECSEEEAVQLASELRRKLTRNQKLLSKPLLLVHNPKAGPGNQEAFDWTLAHLMGRGHQVQVLRTTKAGDAQEQVQRLVEDQKLENYHCVCIWGGDGTIHEVVQGYHRGSVAIGMQGTVPVLRLALFPGGSASALLYTALKQKGLKLSLMNAIYSFYQSERETEVDLYQFSLDGGLAQGVMFLSALAGFLTDVDFESEVLRWLGSARFDIYGAFRCLFPKPIEVSSIRNGQQEMDLDSKKLYSLAFLAATSITPSFHFSASGLSLLSTKDSLTKWLLQSMHETKRTETDIEINFVKETLLSIDGEPYRAKRLKIVKVPRETFRVVLLN